MTAGQHIDYEALQQEAMRSVVRAVLIKVAETGLVGDHHFYIAFNTQAPGANISKRLKEKYPHEMTIVLQHRFWDLEVGEERFEVKLTFDGIPERLVVPFQAVKVFYDPSVPYGLQFEESELMADQSRRSPGMRRPDDGLGDSDTEGPNGLDNAQRLNMRPGNADRSDKRRPPRRPRTDRPDESRPVTGPVEVKPAATRMDGDAKPTPLPIPALSPAGKPQLTEVKSDDPPRGDSGGAKVVDLSKFRKK